MKLKNGLSRELKRIIAENMTCEEASMTAQRFEREWISVHSEGEPGIIY